MDPNSDEANVARARLEDERARLQKSIRALGEAYDEDGAITKGGDAARDTAFAEELAATTSRLAAVETQEAQVWFIQWRARAKAEREAQQTATGGSG